MAVVRAYIADNYINKRGDAPVYVSFYIAREKVQITCKTSVAIKAWDKDAGKVTTRDKFHSDKNLIIDQVKKRENEILVQYRLANKELTKEAFMKEFTNPTDFKSFYEFVKWYQRLRFQEIEPTTAAYHNSVMNKLKLFRAELRFEDLTEDFIREYKVYMKKSLKNKDTTINKNLTTIVLPKIRTENLISLSTVLQYDLIYKHIQKISNRTLGIKKNEKILNQHFTRTEAGNNFLPLYQGKKSYSRFLSALQEIWTCAFE